MDVGRSHAQRDPCDQDGEQRGRPCRLQEHEESPLHSLSGDKVVRSTRYGVSACPPRLPHELPTNCGTSAVGVVQSEFYWILRTHVKGGRGSDSRRAGSGLAAASGSASVSSGLVLVRRFTLETSLTTRLRESVLVCDGAMGTMLYARGVSINRCFDELNLSRPESVQEIHRAYLQAGTQMVETNTFGANRGKLLPHGLEGRIDEINRRGVLLAREAVRESKQDAYVAGAVGPLGSPLHRADAPTPEDMQEMFREQIGTLAEAGVDCILIETISQLEEMRLAIRAARAVCDLPVLAQMTFTDEGSTIFGDHPEEIAPILLAEGADLIGVNCSTGPRPMLNVVERFAAAGELLLSAQPNAGSPQRVEGRYMYFCSPEYMASYARRFIQRAGVNLVGGCCGTTPEHIRAVAAAVRSLQPKRTETIFVTTREAPPPEVDPIPPMEKSPFAAKLLSGSFVASVELNPPRGIDTRKVIDGAREIREAGVDAVNIPDGPRASARMSPLALGAVLRETVGAEVLLHYCCRDRNLLGMQSDLLGAHALGLRNLIIITGDPPKLGDYPNATAVFDVDSIGLTGIVSKLNHGQDLAGNAIGEPTAFLIGVGVDPGAPNLDEEVRRLRAKIEAGAECIFTQPVYEGRKLRELLGRIEDLDLPILVGILPLTSHRNAEFFHNEVPGMTIPDPVRERMRKAGTGTHARREGVAIARAALEEARTLRGIRGAYVMPPFGRYRMALQVLDGFLSGPGEGRRD
ncbi:MAG: bifunctional homocysteine S-methyltransferase/methylenetetrahydrofolate reductase [Candidatus Eisenbacteria bacterium]|nr:bifunctional homocysteine S-methyltransferase/methylenetetrahydrofolate reductase [Candidatus Latescibacterota bacterium]MBD3300954.1 bifunctional homocysteine S-methyltransferase/methylenetetrahydrofolate reductase [Candidatus Eisenbacteria bacterium]